MTKQAVADAAEKLAGFDPVLDKVWQAHGSPPLLRRPATFATLVHVILEQQVSVESAKSTFDRLTTHCLDENGSKVTPESVQAIGDQQLRRLGFSRQKSRYAIALAEDCLSGKFKIQTLPKLPDEEVRAQIVGRLGLGNWSADVFMMMALLRPDVLPVGDLALVKGLGEIDGREYQSSDEVTERAEAWRPFRSIATRMVWQWYVHKRGRDIF